jgi:branched-chain amino acid transport system permease protein
VVARVEAGGGRSQRLYQAREAAVSLGGLWVIVAAVTGLAALGPQSLRLSAMTMLINLMIVVGIYTFTGNSGVFSFGHLVFMMVGAYAGTLLIIPESTKNNAYPTLFAFIRHAHLPTLPATLIGGVTAMIVAAIVAVPLMRLTGIAAALGTFVLLIIANTIGNNWEAVTGGSPGLSGIAGITLWAVLVWALLAIAVSWLFQHTLVCGRLRASREDEIAARSVGISVWAERTLAFSVSAFIVGTAGVLFGRVAQGIYPNAFYLDLTFVTLAMLVVGGLQSLSGAVVGTIVLSVIAEILTRMSNGMNVGGLHIKVPVGTEQVGFALMMLLVLLLKPNGLTGGREFSFGRFGEGFRRPGPRSGRPEAVGSTDEAGG